MVSFWNRLWNGSTNAWLAKGAIRREDIKYELAEEAKDREKDDDLNPFQGAGQFTENEYRIYFRCPVCKRMYESEITFKNLEAAGRHEGPMFEPGEYLGECDSCLQPFHLFREDEFYLGNWPFKGG